VSLLKNMFGLVSGRPTMVATEAKREQGKQRGKNDNHADDGMAAAL
jgi:hypothetical protein